MNINLKGELAIMDSMNLKPNYAALGRKYGMDYRTVKKYHNGYEGRPKTRNKKSKLDYYRTEIVDKLKIKRLTVKGVYEFMVKKYGIERIGTYSNTNCAILENIVILTIVTTSPCLSLETNASAYEQGYRLLCEILRPLRIAISSFAITLENKP